MTDPEPWSEAGLELGKRPHRTKGQGFRISMAERVRAARRVPQAVVKVTSFSRGVRQVCGNLRYITREGTLPLEKDTGEILMGSDRHKELAANWAIDFDSRKNSRDTANIVFSMPRGSKVEALRQAVRKTGAKAFPHHEWVFAVHEDLDHPHAHMMLKMRDWTGQKKLRLRKAELFHLRELFAEAAREQGVRLAASPRAARGVGRKGDRQAIVQMRRKGIVPKVDQAAARDAQEKEVDIKRELNPWEKAMAARHQTEKEIYERYAQHLRSQAKEKGEADRMMFLRAAADLEQFAKTMPKPQTRRQELLERSISHPEPPKTKERSAESGLELEL